MLSPLTSFSGDATARSYTYSHNFHPASTILARFLISEFITSVEYKFHWFDFVVEYSLRKSLRHRSLAYNISEIVLF